MRRTLETLTRLASECDLRFNVEAAPEVLDAPVPEPRAFHLAADRKSVV